MGWRSGRIVSVEGSYSEIGPIGEQIGAGLGKGEDELKDMETKIKVKI